MTSVDDFTIYSSLVSRVRGLNPGPMTLEGTNCYIIGTGTERILVDTGDGQHPNWKSFLLESLKKLKVESLSHILITHSHNEAILSKPCDHSGGVLATLAVASMLSSSKKPRVFKFQREGEDCRFDYEALEDGMFFQTEGATIHVVGTPGHTSDHACFWLQEENALFSGDLIIGKGTTKFEDLSQLMVSFDRIQNLEITRLYTGKGRVIDGRAESIAKIKEIKRHRMEREAQIAKLIQEDMPVTTGELVEKIYQGYPSEVLPFAKETVDLHVEKLVLEGRVRRRDDESLESLAS